MHIISDILLLKVSELNLVNQTLIPVNSNKKVREGKDMAVISKLYDVRKKKGITQTELADKLGTSVRTLRRWETGESTPRLSVAIRLSRIMNVEVEDIFALSSKTT